MLSSVFIYKNNSWLCLPTEHKRFLADKLFPLIFKFTYLTGKSLHGLILNNSGFSISSMIKRELVLDRSFVAWNAVYLLIRLHSLLTFFHHKSNKFGNTILKGYKFNFNYPNNTYLFSLDTPIVVSKMQASERKLLICFAGNAGQFNMPVPIFHSIVSRYFTDIMYFNDLSKNFYIGKESIILDAIQAFKLSQPFIQVSSIGASGGAHMPIILANKKICTRSISCSPALKTYGIRKGSQIESQSTSNRIFYCSSHIIDKYEISEFLEKYSKSINSTIIDLASISDKPDGNHTTLNTLVVNEKFDDELKWLSEF